ncbi:MAG: prolipoprotein diacylglyceryl transferase [Desulfovibrio sp.]|jgi:phosphatidylglycerol:prolipoprotein diacylglycerol transferase|nr:prolipoprotein diacylglyceryl transferase [Desulfovibrio sp.]
MLQYPRLSPDIVSFGPYSLDSGRVIGPFALRWYGMMYLFGFLSAWLLGRYRCTKTAVFTKAQFDDVLVFGFVGVLVGARLGYALFYNPMQFLANPLDIFRVWEGGMSFHGGMLGVMIGQGLAGRRYGKSFFQTMDFMAPLVPPGLFFGRLGNFINAELWGRVTDSPLGMVFPGAGPLPRHPSQLYEAALEGVALFTILWLFSSRPRPTMAVSGLFSLGYGVFRCFAEFFRQPDAHLGYLAFDFVTMGMLLCLPVIATGVILLSLAYARPPADKGKGTKPKKG